MRFMCATFACMYSGTSQILVICKDRLLVIIIHVLNITYREGSSRFGGEDSMLIQISPIFRVMQSKSEMVFTHVQLLRHTSYQIINK